MSADFEVDYRLPEQNHHFVCYRYVKKKVPSVFQEFYVNEESIVDQVQQVYDSILLTLQNSDLHRQENPLNYIAIGLHKLAANGYKSFRENIELEEPLNISRTSKVLAAVFLITTKNTEPFENLIAVLNTSDKIDKTNGQLLLLCCWFFNEQNRCYLLLECNLKCLSKKRKIIKKFIKKIIKGNINKQWLSFFLSCARHMGDQNLMEMLQQNFVAWKDFNEFGIYNGDMKTFEDSQFVPSMRFSTTKNEWILKLKECQKILTDENDTGTENYDCICDRSSSKESPNISSNERKEPDGSIYDRPRDPPGQRSVYIPPGDTFKESYRLSTFIRFPSECPANPRVLATCGFFYTGYKDRVKCFCCGLCVENWIVDDDVTSSRWHRDTCQMSKGEECGNVPISSLFSNFAGPRLPAGGQLAREGFRSPSSFSAPNFGQIPRPGPPGSGSTPAGVLLRNTPGPGAISGGNIPHVNVGTRQTASPVPRQQRNQNYSVVELATIPSINHEQLVRSLDLRLEADRLRTYDSWPPNIQTVHRGDLARCGFFYLGNLDRVQCFSCGGVLRNWNYGDNVDREHRSHFPECRMVRGVETQNVALSARDRPAVPRPEPMLEPPDPTEAEQDDLRNMFPCLAPASAHMRSEDRRFETFDDRWPASQVRATPRQISKAGFFFLGERDRVKCWYCNGGLQNWDPDDEPWTEHAKWFPTCEFLLRRKGPDFVHRIVAMFPNLPRPNLRAPFDVPPRGRRNREPSPPPPIIDPRIEMERAEQQLNEAMNSAIVVAASQMGFETRLIREVVRRKLNSGPMYATVVELVEDLTSFQAANSSDDEDRSENISMQTEPSSLATGVKTPEPSNQPTEPSLSGEASGLTAGSAAAASSVEERMEDISLPEGTSPSMEARIRELQDERKCKICLDNLADVVFVPCGHLCSCTSCAQALRKCPICRVRIEKSIRTYLS